LHFMQPTLPHGPVRCFTRRSRRVRFARRRTRLLFVLIPSRFRLS
jgi:hypothetical protein